MQTNALQNKTLLPGLAALLTVMAGQVRAEVHPLIGEYQTYKVQAGDTLYKIARHNDLNPDFIAKLNKLTTGKVKSGKTIVLPTLHIAPRQPENGIVLNIPERQVYLYRGGKLVGMHPVAVGRADWPTEIGEYKVRNKEVNPKWTPTKEMVQRADIKDDPVPAGKDNPIGDRWIGWSKPGFGFHSTTAPESIGKVTTHGCLRLFPESAHVMFDQVQEGETIYSEYEPLLIGKRDDRYFLCVLPDIYHKGNATLQRVKILLEREGLLSHVDPGTLRQIVADADGLPHFIARPGAAPAAPAPKTAPAKPIGAPKTGATVPTQPGANPENAVAKQIGERLMARYQAHRIALLNPERDGPQLQQLAQQGFYHSAEGKNIVYALPLLRALDRLSEQTTPQHPLTLLSLYRPFGPDRPNEPHGRGMAADIAAFWGHKIDGHNPGEAVEGVLAVLNALPAGPYRLGLPKPPNTDPVALAPPPARPAYWPFFPAPMPGVMDICDCGIDVVAPLVEKGQVSKDNNGQVRPKVVRWENERGAPISALGDARVRAAIQSAQGRGANIHALFPDALDHLHLDVLP